MKKCIKISLSVILVLSLMSCLVVNAWAADNQEISVTPRWTSILRINLDMTFSGTTGSFAASALKQSTADFIEATLFLYKWENNDWEYIDEWYGSKSVGTLVIGEDFTAEHGVEYKIVFEVTAYTNGVPETEIVEHIETCPRN